MIIEMIPYVLMLFGAGVGAGIITAIVYGSVLWRANG
jgi:hypothetical protein